MHTCTQTLKHAGSQAVALFTASLASCSSIILLAVNFIYSIPNALLEEGKKKKLNQSIIQIFVFSLLAVMLASAHVLKISYVFKKTKLCIIFSRWLS